MDHAAEFRRCLIELDVAGVRRLWEHVSPHLPQPKNDDEALHTMHLARSKMETLPPRLREYSEAWLKERETGKIVLGVGIAVYGPPARRAQALETRAAMSEAVLAAIKSGVSLDTEPHEIRRRMMLARDKV